MPEFDPGRRVIAGLFPTAHLPVDTRRDETLRYGWAEDQMIDAKARVPDPRIPEIIPEGVDPFTRMKRAQRIGPALREQTVKGFPHLGTEQRVVDPKPAVLRRARQNGSALPPAANARPSGRS